MNKLCLIICCLSFTIISFSQYCTNVGPTSTLDSNVESVNLIGDVGAISFVGCPGVIGLQDLTLQSTSLGSGNTYSISIQFGTCGGNYSGKGEVWIDFNGDQTFSSNESIGTWSGTPTTAISTFSFSVPTGIMNGTTRMRVMQQEGGGTSFPLDPCASYQWGSTMDFSIELTDGIDCSGFQGNTLGDAIISDVFPYTDVHSTSVCYSNNDLAYNSADVFYLVLPNVNSSELNVSLCGSSFDTFLSVFDTDGNVIGFNDDGNCDNQSELIFSTVGIDSAYVVVQGWGNESGAYELNITESILNVLEIETNNIKLFPNPTDMEFKVTNVSNADIVIHDVAGNIVFSRMDYNGSSITTNEFVPGMYFVSYTMNGITKTLKLIKNK